MLGWVRRLPFFVILMAVGALAMYLPASVALAEREWASARAYFYSGTLLLVLTSMLALVTAGYRSSRQARSQLLTLLAAFSVLPVLLAVPLYESVGTTRFLNAYFEMVSSFTTTGATVFDDPARLTGADHLWRALVGWMGGFLVWVMAIAVMAPLNLGGFEVLGPMRDQGGQAESQITRVAAVPERLWRFALLLGPIYGSLTLVLWIGLLIMGDTPLVAISHAMSTLATSGISPVGGTTEAGSGFGGELLILLFFGFALSRRTFARDMPDYRRWRVIRDPEMRMGLICATLVPALLFLRHWAGAYEVSAAQSLGQGLQALWGGMFTVLSFLTTTGFESASWEAARAWSGLETPGLLLLGLAVTGGGVATTAGGVKLLRVYVLYLNGARELRRLVYPSSVGSSERTRFMRREGAVIAWIFFMLFAMSVAAVMLALSFVGLNFEDAVVFTIAALSTTGPLASVAGDEALSYAILPDAAKAILAASMVLGRLETLAIIALLNPELWRN